MLLVGIAYTYRLSYRYKHDELAIQAPVQQPCQADNLCCAPLPTNPSSAT